MDLALLTVRTATLANTAECSGVPEICRGETIAQLVGAQPGSCVAGDPTQIFDLCLSPGMPA